MTKDEIVAAYLLDRADQYEAESGCCVALADAAVNVMLGEHTKSHREGEFDADLIRRVRSFKSRRPKPVDPHMGVDPDEDEEPTAAPPALQGEEPGR